MIKQQFVAALNSGDGALPGSETFDYVALFLNKIVPDEENARFFPTVIIDDELAKQFSTRKITKPTLVRIANAEKKVIVGKGVFVNCMEYGKPEWSEINRTIQTIVTLAQSIELSELIQPPTVYPIEDGRYKILTGHRRFFAMVYSQGISQAAKIKVYNKPPLLKRIKQFQENANREELSQSGKLEAFIAATRELETLEDAQKLVGRTKMSVRESVGVLGISAGAYDNYNVLTRYQEVIKAYKSGAMIPFVKMKKLVLDVEKNYRTETNKTRFNIDDKRAIGKRIESLINGKQKRKESTGAVNYVIKNITRQETMKKLLTTNFTEMDIGIDWDNVDWSSKPQVEEILVKVIDHLESD
ncbi:ParB/RepB/Spo0J family partition protein [Planctobacterium marinum]|uniref:ParB/RepB/Spo0J family partition protein n=1 Tax=Planctobacterium marinum TaxID=1631968 RepID=UPI001E40B156|nr:ParB/RepB/Spo0J family partition protein [Planctobacterium marinum]MCC2606937.1 ParB N-terminal domain-containing protein [Planctobacterium marinum]